MRRPGREFGSEQPKVVYVALRWNGLNPRIAQERRMIRSVEQKLELLPDELRIYNLCPPKRDRGMQLSLDEYKHVEKTVHRIQELVVTSESVLRIVVGGRSGPMPLVALLLKLFVPRVGIEIRSHHKARAVSGGSLSRPRVLRPVGATPVRSKSRIGLANPVLQRTR
jgi:hypothetical protein